MTVISGESYVPKQAKIKNLFARIKEGENKGKIVIGDFMDEAFPLIGLWDVTEKIDGMNMRIHANQNGDFLIGGKTDSAQIPGDLVEHIEGLFPDVELEGEETGLTSGDSVRAKHILDICAEFGYPGYSVTLFGEGYGPGINGNLHQADEKKFVLYDVKFTKDDGRSFFACIDEVQQIAKALGILVVPVTYDVSLLEVVKMAYGLVDSDKDEITPRPYVPEGFVAYPAKPLYDSFGNRICFKLKVKDIARAVFSDGVELSGLNI